MDEFDQEIRDLVEKVIQNRPDHGAIGVSQKADWTPTTDTEQSWLFRIFLWCLKKIHRYEGDMRVHLETIAAPDGHTAVEFAAYIAEKSLPIVTPHYRVDYEQNSNFVYFKRTHTRIKLPQEKQKVPEVDLGTSVT
jgi:hypothetical protein